MHDPRDPGGRRPYRELAGPGAVRDASEARDAAREADRAAADVARRELRARGLVVIEPDERIRVMLAPGEEVVAIRRDAALDRRQPCPESGLRGDLYVTTRRLIHLGRRPLAYDLDAVREAIVAGDELLLAVDPDLGLTVAVDDPRLLRVLISAARSRSGG